MAVQVSTHTTLLNRLADEKDMSAWADFQRRYRELIVSYARRRGLQPADCDDVLQDVLFGLTKALPAFHYDPARGRFRAYLKTIVNRAVGRRFRQKYPERSLDTIEIHDT